MTRNQIFSLIIAAIIILIVFILVDGDYLTNIFEKNSIEKVDQGLNFAAVGDWGCSFETSNTVRNILDKDVELVLGLGDYSYVETADCWFEIVNPIDEKMKIVFGNHDIENPVKLDQISKQFNLTDQYYSFNYENIHFTILSSLIPYETGSDQYSFVNDDLYNASTDLTIDWMVVLIHHPLYTSPTEEIKIAQKKLRENYHPLFENYGVDLVLQGHVHNYQRSYPLHYNNLEPSEPIVTSYEKNYYVDPKGQIFATVGTGGESIHAFTEISPYTVNSSEEYGFLNFEIKKGETNSLIGTFYVNNGTIQDQFTITKYPKDVSYKYLPSLKLNGDNYEEVSRDDLQLANFSTALWFKTDEGFFPETTAYLVNKGGSGVDIPGNNMNYGIWIAKNGLLRTGFETLRGIDTTAASSFANNDGKWHFVVSTFDGEMLRLYVDGSQVARKLGNGFPDDTGNQPLRVGANSLRLDGFFEGEIDEVRVWNRALSTEEIEDQYFNGIFDNNGQLVYLPFE